MVWSLEPLQISSGRVLNGRILFLKSSKAGGLNFGAGGPYGPVQIRDIREFRLYGRPRLTASIPDIVRPDAYSDLNLLHFFFNIDGLIEPRNNLESRKIPKSRTSCQN